MALRCGPSAWAAVVCMALGVACGDNGDEPFKPADAGAETAEPCDSDTCMQASDGCADSCSEADGGGAGHAGTSSADAGTESGNGQAGAASDAGEVPDAQEADQAADQAAEARDTLCEDYCVCMDRTCFAYSGYPFSGLSQCMQFCAGWSAEERACFPSWCDEARNGSPFIQHVCEHAWGAYGLLEC